MTLGYREFEFDLPGALLKSMILTLDAMSGAPLEEVTLQAIPEAQGVYQLLLNGKVVYVGKTDSGSGLHGRLARHACTIQHRCNLAVEDVTFKAVRVFVFTAMDLETQLIGHYRVEAPESWNNSGFGSNDPGRNRDKTRVNPKSFDAQYPIDLDKDFVLGVSGSVSVGRLLQILRRQLPYTFRFEYPHADLTDRTFDLPTGTISARTLLTMIVEALPDGWQATALAGRVILYKEREHYPSGQIIASR